jgi:hypothetical protein
MRRVLDAPTSLRQHRPVKPQGATGFEQLVRLILEHQPAARGH